MLYKRLYPEKRYCLYCGKDISDKKLSAKICGNSECEKQRKIEKKKSSNKQHLCMICGCDISDLSPQAKICKKEECHKIRSKQLYANTQITKTCTCCGNEFIGTGKQLVCSDCRKTRYERKVQNTKQIKQYVYCKNCGVHIETLQKYKTIHIQETIYKLCNDCLNKKKEENYKQSSERMKKDNPMFNEETKAKVSNTLRNNYIKKCNELGIEPCKPYIRPEVPETKEELSKRMKENNPMFNKEAVEKMKNTLQEHIADGTIKYKKGSEHWLWKGGREFNGYVRVALRKWVKYMFEKAKFTCQHCGKTHTELHVHHTKPLRDIISEFLDKNNYTIEYINSIAGSQEYINFIQKIVDYHFQENENISIVVCPKCHNELDPYYKQKKYD